MLIRSRLVLPMSRPVIENGALHLVGNRIAAVGPWEELKSKNDGEMVDLGESILLPGFVNAHCHLDYTHMAGRIAPTRHFVDWIKAILAVKASWSYSDYAASWVDGARMLLQTGTTTVADMEAVPELLPEVCLASPLRVFSFLEMTCVRSGRLAADILHEALEKIGKLSSPRHPVRLSPHALYSTNAELLELTAAITREQKWPVTTHVAESEPEWEMFQSRCGPLYDWLKAQRDVSDCCGFSPVQQIARSGLLSPQFLAVHVNYLAPGDAQLLAAHGSSVAHCPRSHAYFAHRPFPYAALSQAGVNICLGTDSLATVIPPRRHPAELSMLAEMRHFAEANAQIPPATILQMATRHGAKALGMAGEIGELSPNAGADVIAIPFSGQPVEAEEAVVHFPGPVAVAMIAGHWAIPPK